MQFKRSLVAALTAPLWLAACGGGGDDPTPSERGQVLASSLAGQATAQQIDAGTQASGLQPLSGPAQCNVDVRYIVYVTRDPQGQPATASAGVLVPSGSSAACSGNRPVVLYAHGTTFTRTKNMAQVSDTDPDPAVDNSDSEAKLVMAMFAAQGYIVVAPNYLGYDRSSLTWHPYLNAEAQAIDMIDALRAAKKVLTAESATKPSSHLFITGYSQGGHVAMATHKVIERDYAREFTVTASGPMSGPYNLAKMTTIINSDGTNANVNAGGTLFTPLLLTSYQKSYGNIYSSPSDAYQAPYASTAETLFPTDTPIPTLIGQGKLPADPTFRQLFGAGGLINESFRQAFFSDPNNGFKAAVERNTLLGWTPQKPMALCYGAMDPTVFAFNSTDAAADFNSRLPAELQVPAFDLETTSSGTPPHLQAAFSLRKQQVAQEAVANGAVDGGTSAVLAKYHGELVPPFCAALIRGFFGTVLMSSL
ncbi:alpha/beta hydrolase family protein [Caldimonas aquatica]|uniref:Prolyl oligopeptidase family serine peptidase n=2 Tax=Pseudomonadota TaxID=1224 RepID=A0ABY6MS19_9BURK|nr:prolyl oligopeptidase family serine peptidase [Schlegelella aquatica]UZD54792.1 prolyl oligopeptidase family serine peptidase [Schlegelella aquatica]